MAYSLRILCTVATICLFVGTAAVDHKAATGLRSRTTVRVGGDLKSTFANADYKKAVTAAKISGTAPTDAAAKKSHAGALKAYEAAASESTFSNVATFIDSVNLAAGNGGGPWYTQIIYAGSQIAQGKSGAGGTTVGAGFAVAEAGIKAAVLHYCNKALSTVAAAVDGLMTFKAMQDLGCAATLGGRPSHRGPNEIVFMKILSPFGWTGNMEELPAKGGFPTNDGKFVDKYPHNSCWGPAMKTVFTRICEFGKEADKTWGDGKTTNADLAKCFKFIKPALIAYTAKVTQVAKEMSKNEKICKPYKPIYGWTPTADEIGASLLYPAEIALREAFAATKGVFKVKEVCHKFPKLAAIFTDTTLFGDAEDMPGIEGKK